MQSALNDIDRKKVRQAFHRHATEYDCHAIVQKRVVAHMSQLVAGLRPRRVLDIGCGTGSLLGSLRNLFPAASFAGIDLAPAMIEEASRRLCGDTEVFLQVGDAEALPFQDGSFDLVTSTSTFQWLPDLRPAFREARRVLEDTGIFRFALFGEKTLFELRSSYRAAAGEEGAADRTHTFHAAAAVRAALVEAGFHDADVAVEFEVEWYTDVTDLIKAVRGVGAGNASAARARGLGERRVMLRMMDIYRKRFGSAAGIPATYEVIYAVGRK